MEREGLKEPLVGEELIRLSIEGYHVHLEFTDTVLQLGCAFRVRHGGVEAMIDPLRRSGDVAVLWGLIGGNVLSVAWADSVTLTWEDGSELLVPPSDGIRGTLLDRHEMMVEDF